MTKRVVSLSPSPSPRQSQFRWGAWRPVDSLIGTDPESGLAVGEISVVADPDVLAGLVAWVLVHPPYLGQGYGLALHRAAAERCGRLLLDTVALGTHRAYDGVSVDELRVWDSMVRSPDWHVGFAAGGQVLYAEALRAV